MSKEDRHRFGPRLMCAMGLVGAGLTMLAFIGPALGGCSAAAALETAGDLANGSLAHESYRVQALPSWFAEELFDASEATEAYANEQGTVFGLVLPENADAAFAWICDRMAEGAWIRAESGTPGCASFVREDGPPSWALVTCTDVGAGASVVVCVDGGQS